MMMDTGPSCTSSDRPLANTASNACVSTRTELRLLAALCPALMTDNAPYRDNKPPSARMLLLYQGNTGLVIINQHVTQYYNFMLREMATCLKVCN